MRTFHNLLVTSSEPLRINTDPSVPYWLSHYCASAMRISPFLLKSTLELPDLTSMLLLIQICSYVMDANFLFSLLAR